jgi:Tfp pilus assembly protein PilF
MNRALALDRQTPPSVTLFSNLAEAYRLQGRPESALESAAAGLKLHPDAFELHNSVGVSFSALNKKTEAIAAFRRAVGLQPFDADANFNLGYSLLEQGDEAAALTSLRQALVKQPTFSKALMWLAQYEFNAGEMSEARLLIERLYDAYWGVPEVRRLWAEWHFKAGAIASTSDAQQAETLYRAGLKIDDGLSDLHLGLGALLVGEKRILEAKAALFRVQELTPEDPRGFLYMGQALLAEGQTTAARQQLQLGLDLATLSGQSATAERCRQLLRTL